MMRRGEGGGWKREEVNRRTERRMEKRTRYKTERRPGKGKILSKMEEEKGACVLGWRAVCFPN